MGEQLCNRSFSNKTHTPDVEYKKKCHENRRPCVSSNKHTHTRVLVEWSPDDRHPFCCTWLLVDPNLSCDAEVKDQAGADPEDSCVSPHRHTVGLPVLHTGVEYQKSSSERNPAHELDC